MVKIVRGDANRSSAGPFEAPRPELKMDPAEIRLENFRDTTSFLPLLHSFLLQTE